MGMIPHTLEAITVDWLAQVIEAPVQSIEIVDEHHGTTGRGLLKVTYAQDQADYPRQLFIKLPPQDPQQRQFVTSTGMGKREAMFYRTLAKEVNVRVPRCYFADTDEAGEHYIMLLEDLQQSGCSFRNASSAYSLAYIESVLEGFATLHAPYLQSRRFENDLSWLAPPMQHAMGAVLVKRAFEHYQDDMPAIFSEAAELFLSHTDRIYQLWNEGPVTLVHGDVHDGNLFMDQAQAGFLDWALICKTSGMRDLANFMVGSMRPEDREAHQRTLIERYRERMIELGAPVPSLEVLWQQYQWHAFYTWVAATTTVAMGSEWQPINYTMKTLERVHRALENIGTLASLRAAL